MANKSYKEINKLVDHLAISPASVLDHSYEMLEAALDGEIDIVDPTSPYVNLLECAATGTAASIVKAGALTRKIYWNLAQTITDLYPHMSDGDFAGMYASPVQDHVVSFGLDLKQIREFAIRDTVTGISKITIPKDTVFTAQETHFTLHHAVNLLVYDSGEVRAFFDLSVTSPLKTRNSNIISTRVAYFMGTAYFLMDLPCDQVNVISESSPITSSSRWALEVPFADKFYHARAYFTTDGNTWTEMHVTHDAETYDPLSPTVVLSVSKGVVTAVIPDIYINESKVGNLARLDVYTTKGKQTIDLGALKMPDWGVVWNDFSRLSTAHVAPLEDITGRVIFSEGKTAGGGNGMTFEQVRNRVVYNLHGKNGAYTEFELKGTLLGLGYVASKRKDTLTDRIYVAAKDIANDDAIKAAGLTSGVGTINERITVFTGRTDLPNTMIRNSKRATIKPVGLFKEIGYGVTLMGDADRAVLEQSAVATLADTLNATRHYYTPFHHVIDYSEPVLQTRAYDLASAKESYRNFVASNNSVGFIVTTKDVKVVLEDETYVITVTTEAPKDLDHLRLQMSYRLDITGRVSHTADAVIVSDTISKFVFRLPTKLDINSDNQFDFIFKDPFNVDTAVRAGIETQFDFVYSIHTTDAGTSSFDDKIVRGVIPGNVTPLTYEQVSIRFGKHMDGLYLRSRNLIEAPVYKKHLLDVPAVHTENIYKTDGLGAVYTIVDGKPKFELLHGIGDPKLDKDGKPIYLARAGSNVLDDKGQPIEVVPADFSREIRMTLFDARFRYATDAAIVAYRKTIPAQISTFLDGDITRLRKSILERTELYFEPLSTDQASTIMIGEGREIMARTSLSFKIEYQITPLGYEDEAFRQSIIKRTMEVIATELATNKFSLSHLSGTLDDLGEDVILNVTVDKPLPGSGMAAITDGVAAFSIANSLRSESNGTLSIVPNVSISFVK